MAVVPTGITLDKTEVTLTATETSVTLTPTFTPEDATEIVTWTSSDETVATVANGVVTAVASGTTTITVTSTLDENVKATCEVTVDFPETEVATEDVVIDGPALSTVTYGENLIKNGTFEYPNPFQGWKSGANGNCDANNYNIVTDGDSKYIQAKESKGAGDSHSISTGWAIESGKTYVFGYKVKATAAGNSQYHVVSMTNTIGTETAKVSNDATPVTTDWTDVKYKFTNTEGYAFVQFRARWLANSTSFDEFYLVEVTGEETVGNVQYALDAIPTANIGTGAFQYSQDAVDAANALVQGTATVADVEAAYEALTTVNAPADGQLFNVVLTYGGWTYDNKAMTYIANGRTDAGLYNIQYKEVANQNLAQAFTFTKVEGNNYKMSQIDADGNARYISTGVPYSGNTAQIRTTTNADEALVVTVIPTTTDGKWNLRNTEANNYIGSQDAGVYTVNSHIDFNIVETHKPSIIINTTAAGWGTTMLPFAAEKPADVKVYSCAEADGATLTLVEVEALEANKPYIIEGAWNETLTGDAQGTQLQYTEGMLTGTYERIPAPNGCYILQKHDDKVGFFPVDTEKAQPSVPANRAYLTAPEGGVKAFFLDDATGINGVFDALQNGDIYDLTGRKVQHMQKGNVYIVNGRKVVVK
ncbi:MAG: carbohydrate binding domain-containing protein [Bacteroidaceae bacterium]|nr:carbohydrate binding domain-containing protein [Bacteroidaceae bacterium]